MNEGKDTKLMKLIHDIKNPILSITHSIEPLREFQDDNKNDLNTSAASITIDKPKKEHRPKKEKELSCKGSFLKIPKQGSRRMSADNILPKSKNKIKKAESYNNSSMVSSILKSNNKCLYNIFKNVNQELEDLTEMIEGFKFEFKSQNNMLLKETPVSVNSIQLVEMIKNTHHTLTETSKNRLHLKIKKGFPIFIQIPKSIVKRIVNNFITNSLKHTTQGIVNVSFYQANRNQVNQIRHQQISSKPDNTINQMTCLFGNPVEEIEYENYLCIEVEDNGVGIEKDRINRIFDEKESDQTSTNWDGCGLGLPICKKLALHIGSFIFYQSQPGVSTVFILCIPITDSLKEDRIKFNDNNNDINNNSINESQRFEHLSKNERMYPNPGPEPVNNQQKFSQSNCSSFEEHQIIDDQELVINFNNQETKFVHKCNCLIIAEDNKNILDRYLSQANKHGIEVKAFSNGSDCLRWVTEDLRQDCHLCAGSIVITDLVMPYMNGIELARNLKEIVCNKSPKIILLSADDINKDNNMYYLFDELIEKPLKLSRLKDWQEELISLNIRRNTRRNATIKIEYEDHFNDGTSNISCLDEESVSVIENFI